MMDAISGGKAAAVVDAQRQRSQKRKRLRESAVKPASPDAANVQPISRNNPIPAPPFWGARVTPAAEIPFAGMFAGMDLKTLYRLHWGARGTGAEFDRLIREEFEPMRLRLQREAEEQGWITPRACYGFFPCQSEGLDLVVYDPAGFSPGSLTPRGKIEEVVRFSFPRQSEREGLCLSDYFSENELDVLPLQIVTVGPKADTVGPKAGTAC